MNTPIQSLEILRPFARMVAEELALLMQPKDTKESVQLRGIPGIMKIFQCSRSKASRIKDSGDIDCAITRISARVFLVDKDKALSAMEKKKGGRNY